MILVTGGAGFIGANFVLDWLAQSDEAVLNVDKLTYAGNLGTLKSLQGNPKHVFARVDICDRAAIDALLAQHKPRAIVHFAAESHVDRSIHGPADFVQTNVVGTFTLLEAARQYWSALGTDAKAAFRFLHVSTDEVFGSLSPADPQFSKPRRTRRTARTRRRRRAPTTSYARITTRTGCRCSRRTARTTTARISSPRS